MADNQGKANAPGQQNKADRGAAASGAPGQQKLHQIRNASGETREVSQEDWRTNRKQYQTDGWERVDADETEDDGPGDEQPA